MHNAISNQFYMPAEWHPHQCCWMGWPRRAESFPQPITVIQQACANVIQAIAQFEPVKLITSPAEEEYARIMCQNQVEIVHLPLDDIWLRDTAPTFVINDQKDIAGVNWQFNAWGGELENLADYRQDVELAKNILQYLKLPQFSAPLVLEGGSIHVDGQGTVLTTEQCLLNENRNPHLSRTQIENYLHTYLGTEKVIWLGKGLEHDETAGHIDNLACFIRPGVVAALTTTDPQDSHYPSLQENLRRLRQATDAKGRSLDIIEIPQPQPRYNGARRLSLSYINFYIANGAIIMPIFNDPADQQAIDLLTQAFPHYQIIPVYSLDIVHGEGGIHCITQQQPQP